MTTKEAIHFAECLKNNWTINFDDLKDFCDMAIEALSKMERSDEMNDLISRQDAIDLIDGLETKRLKGQIELMFAPAISGLMSLPSAQQWIPCSERLPEQSGEYLVTVYCTKYITFIDKFDYTPTSDGWVDPETAIDWNDYVVAWMSLPQPWKEVVMPND